MRLWSSLLLSLSCFTIWVAAQDTPVAPSGSGEKHGYQSDVTRLRSIVINSLYSHRDIFLRELLSNANDALEKLRLSSLTDKNINTGENPLNISVKAIKDEDGNGGRLIITDYGIGMSPEEMTANLGTLAKSGTSEFLAKAESADGTGQGNLIGAFGLGFYSSFLVANRVYVASIPPKSAKNPSPSQNVFSSSADESSFEVYADPRGNTLGRGTEVTLILKDDALEFLDTMKLRSLVEKHSAFSSRFPIYLHSIETEEVPIESDEEDKEATKAESGLDDDEAVLEDADDDAEDDAPKTKTVTKELWLHLNQQPPIWARDPKDITDEEYTDFYKAYYKEFEDPLAWHHFAADAGSGVSFRAILFIPKQLPHDFWSGPTVEANGISILNKRVFVTSELGQDALPKWVSWLRAIVDAEDLPLNVSRETLQSSKFLRQIRQVLMRRLIQLITRIAEEDPAKYEEIYKGFGNSIKLGAVEGDFKDRPKLAALARFASNQRNSTSLDEYVKNRKQGQEQVFFLSGLGQSAENLAKSIFIEKLTARGYEALLVNEPLDEILFQNLAKWENLRFQDVSRTGMKFGDEDPEEEAQKEKELQEKFQPLIEWFKNETVDIVMDVTLSNRLVSSPCAIVSQMFGYSASMERLMNAQHNRQDMGMRHEYAKKQKNLELNPNSPLIEGLLRRVERLPADADERDEEEVAELREVATILIDSALVRSGFDVSNSNLFFERVDRVLRRSLGVSQAAKADTTVKPAPPVDPEPLTSTSEAPKASVEVADYLKDQIDVQMEEISDEEYEAMMSGVQHDEL